MNVKEHALLEYLTDVRTFYCTECAIFLKRDIRFNVGEDTF